MGVDPFLIAPTLNLAIAQRLARKIADNSTAEIDDPGVKAIIENSFKDLPEEFKRALPIDKTS